MGGCHLIREDSSSAKCQLPCVYVKNKKKCGRAGRGCGGTLRYVYNIGLFFNYSPRTMINVIGLIVHEKKKPSGGEGPVNLACG